jgi:type I restriction-modification system DNA methylase subunit
MPKNKTNIKASQVHAYAYILRELKEKKGWNKNNVYTQQECLTHKEFKKYFDQKHPENIVEIDEKNYYIIEAENERKKIEQALTDAREYYADTVNKSNRIKALFVTGIAGNKEEGYIAKSQFSKNGKWETITENDVEITGLLSKKQVEDILQQQTAHLKDVEISEDEFLETAESINEILHENSINKDYRARFISALLLAMSDGKEIDVTQECDVLIENINSRVKHILRQHNKLLFSNFIKIDEPSSVDNHTKIKEAIKRTYQELLNLNIRSAMNSGKDVLGTFYEVFLKYGNGAKDIGIVLTPRHITRFVSEVLDINYKDLVLDPCCGTGGFLVSALDEVRKKTKNKNDSENFRLNGLYGIEDQDAIISLAIVNMIFRSDGKANMIEGDCFRKWLTAKTNGRKYYADYLPEDKEDRISPITKVMMNPPFALKKGAEKEYKFVEHALKQMEDGGILFTVLPISVMIEEETKLWRKEVLLKENRLLAVVTFPEDLFYPIGVMTLGLFVQKGIPHTYKKDKVYFARCIEDGFAKKKGVRKQSKKVRNMLEEIKVELKEFIKNRESKIKSIAEFKKVCLLNEKDELFELAPEAHLDSKVPTEEEIKKGIEQLVRDNVAFLIKNAKEDEISDQD